MQRPHQGPDQIVSPVTVGAVLATDTYRVCDVANCLRCAGRTSTHAIVAHGVRSGVRRQLRHAQDRSRRSTDSALRCRRRAADRMEMPSKEYRLDSARILHTCRHADFAEQRASPGGVSGVYVGRTTARDVAHFSTDVLIVVTRQRRAGEGDRSADGPRQRRYDAERVHASTRRSNAAAVDKIGDGLFTIVHNASR
jgi:hypothetical protein